MSLESHIHHLTQQHVGYSHNPLLASMPAEKCRKIDQKSRRDPTVHRYRNQILNLLDVPIGYTKHLDQAYEIFAECSAYIEISESGLDVKSIESSSSAPDFYVNSQEKFYVEDKVLNFYRGAETYKAAIDSSLNANIEIERTIKEGHRFAMAESCIAPLGYTYTAQDCPPRAFIETIIDKVTGNLKRSQYERGPTFLLCDLSRLAHPSKPKKACQPFHVDEKSGYVVTGELWQIAFGRLYTPVLSVPDFEGAPTICGYLDREGILNDYDYINGLIFRCSDLNNSITYCALANSEQLDVFGFDLQKLCDTLNDNENSKAFEFF